MSRLLIFFLLGIFGLLLVGCHADEKKAHPLNKSYIFTVTANEETSHLYFNSILLPLNKIAVLSPADGRITAINFQYGDLVRKKQLLLKIRSEKLAQSYQQAVAQFFQKKSNLENSRQAYAGDQVLHKVGAISDEEFTNSANIYKTSQLDFYSAKLELEKILEKVHINITEILKYSTLNSTILNKIFALIINIPLPI